MNLTMFQATHQKLSILKPTHFRQVKQWTDRYEISFGGDFFRALARNPIVYVFLKDNRAIYVGMSRRGIGRPLSKGHKRNEVRRTCDDVRVFMCKDVKAAKELEEFLIRKLKPVENKPATGGRRRVYDTQGPVAVPVTLSVVNE